ncbi:MAG: NAD(P)H-dependent dehydrogenase/reductase [Planctomycetes bacterium]|jgi:nitroreductase|nr:NAD(P)H-dependent dehydrogenase/reductase [Planctomycetota bacterium]
MAAEEHKDFMQLLRQRRSIRRFEPRPIEPDKVTVLKEAVLRSPSSRNLCPWAFVFVDDKNVLAALSEAKPHGATFLKEAALGIVVCGDESVSDVWIEDCSIASFVAQCAALSLGLGSCWIQIRRRQRSDGTPSEVYIRDVLGLPENWHVESIIAVGYPAEQPKPIPQDHLKNEHVYDNHWGHAHTRRER